MPIRNRSSCAEGLRSCCTFRRSAQGVRRWWYCRKVWDQCPLSGKRSQRMAAHICFCWFWQPLCFCTGQRAGSRTGSWKRVEKNCCWIIPRLSISWPYIWAPGWRSEMLSLRWEKIIRNSKRKGKDMPMRKCW